MALGGGFPQRLAAFRKVCFCGNAGSARPGQLLDAVALRLLLGCNRLPEHRGLLFGLGQPGDRALGAEGEFRG